MKVSIKSAVKSAAFALASSWVRVLALVAGVCGVAVSPQTAQAEETASAVTWHYDSTAGELWSTIDGAVDWKWTITYSSGKVKLESVVTQGSSTLDLRGITTALSGIKAIDGKSYTGSPCMIPGVSVVLLDSPMEIGTYFFSGTDSTTVLDECIKLKSTASLTLGDAIGRGSSNIKTLYISAPEVTCSKNVFSRMYGLVDIYWDCPYPTMPQTVSDDIFILTVTDSSPYSGTHIVNHVAVEHIASWAAGKTGAGTLTASVKTPTLDVVWQGTDVGVGSGSYPQYIVADFTGDWDVVSDWHAGSGNWQERDLRRVSDGKDFKVVKFTATGSTAWTVPSGVTELEYLLVGGGGAGGGGAYQRCGGGGGGAGGFFQSSATVSGGSTVTVNVGAGGQAVLKAVGGDGESSTLSGAVSASVPGGGGGGYGDSTNTSIRRGRDGASGGGGGAWYATGASVESSGGDGTTGYGSNGGKGEANASYPGGGGGGGAGAAGADHATNVPGVGGRGLASEITGEPLHYAGGGGGGAGKNATASGGLGGGGTGGYSGSATSGEDGLGGGGGGSNANNIAGNGGSGVVIIRYAVVTGPTAVHISTDGTKILDESDNAVGDVLTVGGDTVLRFTSTARPMTWSVPENVTKIEYLVVGGGGGGGGCGGANACGGGGGAGAFYDGSKTDVGAGDEFEITIGKGGSGSAAKSSSAGTKGGDSVVKFNGDAWITAKGGGGGGYQKNDGLSGGCGGGAGGRTGAGGQALDADHGNAGGSSSYVDTTGYPSGGGGGAGGPGGNSSGTTQSGAGGVGKPSLITGTSLYYAGGGGGGAPTASAEPGAGGDGGGGAGGLSAASPAVAGTDNLGGGGGGAYGASVGSSGADGGSGVVIIRYSTGTPITEDMISIDPAKPPYTGNAITPSVTVTDGSSKTLTLNTDYTLSGDLTKTDVGGPYTITVTGMGDYTGSASKTWSITKATPVITGPTISGWAYGATPNEPSASSTFGTVKYRYYTSADVGMDKPTKTTPPGTYKVQAYVEASDNWNAAESAKVSFTISQASIDSATVTVTPASAPWTGAAHTPTVKVMLGGTDITAQCDLSWLPSGLTDVDTYMVTATAKSGSAYTDSATGSYEITKATTTISALRMEDFIQYRTVPAPTCTVSPSGVPVAYTFWDNEGCTGTAISPAELKDKKPGTYYVKATVEGTDNYTAATATAPFEILDPESHKEEIPLPDPVSKPYNGKLQRSGIPETTYYTVVEPADAINVTDEGYGVTLRVKEEYKNTHGFGSGEVKSSSATVKFYIVKGKNEWVTNPQLTPTYWYVSDDSHVTLNVGTANFGDEFKTVEWYNRDKSVLLATGAENRPTAVGEYVLRIEVPETSNYEVLAYEIGFIIYADLDKIQVPVPTVADQEYTGASQTANVPASDLWTMTCTAQQTVGNYTAKLALKDPSKYVWRLANGTTSAAEQTINWKIVKAKNEWTTVPQVTTTVSSRTYSIGTCAKGTAITVVDGVAKFGTVSASGTIDTSSAEVKTRTYTVPGTSNYEGLTYTLILRVGDSGSASASTLYWNANASGLWQDQKHWGNKASGYPNGSAAVATFGSQCAGTNPIVVDSWEQIRLNQLNIESGAASDITLNLHYSDTSKYDYKYSPYTDKSASALGVYLNGTDYVYTEPLSLTVAADKTLTLYDGKYFFKSAASSLGAGATLRVRCPSTVSRGSIGGNPSKIDYDLFVKPSLDKTSRKFTVGQNSTIEVDHAAAVFGAGTDWNASGWKLNVRDGGICFIDETRSADAKTTYTDKNWEINVDDAMFLGGGTMRFGDAAAAASCNGPVIRVSGANGEFYSKTAFVFGSNSAAVSNPLRIELTYPAGGFSWGSYKWDASGNAVANTQVGSPIGANQGITIGSNVRFTVDLSAYFAAKPGLVTVPLVSANISRTDGQYLTVPGASGGTLVTPDALAAWYENNFELKGVNKDEWELAYDESVYTIFLRRKGAWDVDDDYMGFVWHEGVSGRWADNSRWNVGRVPNLDRHTVRFNGTSSYAGYDLDDQIEVDMESQPWEIQLLNLAEPVNLKFKSGTLTVHDNTWNAQKIMVRQDARLTFEGVDLKSYTGAVSESASMGIKINQRGCLVFDRSSLGSVLDPSKSPWIIDADCIPDGTGNERVVFRNGNYSIQEFIRHSVASSFADSGEGTLRVENATLAINQGVASRNRTHFEVVGENSQLTLGSKCWYGHNQSYRYRWDCPQFWLAADGASITASQQFPTQSSDINLAKMSGQLFEASDGVYTVGTFYLADAQYTEKGSTADPFSSKNPNNFDLTACRNNEIRISGERGAFRSTDSLYLGHANNPDDGENKVTLALPAKGWAKAPLSAANTLAMRSKLKLNIDASAVKVTTTFPIASAATLTLAESIYDSDSSSVTHIGSNVTVTLPEGKTTCPYSFEQKTEGGVTTLYLTVEAGEQRVIELPTIEPKVWTGEHQTADVEESADYEVVENNGGTNVGKYRVLLRLTDPEGTIWEGDDPSADRELTFEITKVNNAWATMPSVDPQYWNEGGKPVTGPGTLTPGVPTYGGDTMTVTHSANWNGSTMPTTKGSYWIRYEVPEGQNWTALSETVNFNVYGENESPTGPEDGDNYEYIWARNGNGYWTMTDSWQGETGATFGYPSCNLDHEPRTYAIARFTAQHYLQGVTVRASQDITTGAISFESGARPVTLDFGGQTLALQNGVTVANADTDYAFANGTYNLVSVSFTAAGARIVADQGATVNVGALSLAGRLPTIVARNGGVFAYAENLYLGATVSKVTYQPASLTAEGGKVQATGDVQLGTVVNEDIPALTIKVSGEAGSGAGIETTGGTLKIGTATYDQTASPTVNIVFPAGGFATAPIRTTGSGKALTINAGTKLALDVSKLEVGTYEIARATGTLTADPTALTANAAFTVRRGTKAVLVTSDDDKALCVKVSSLGLTLTLSPTADICDGSSWKGRFTKTVTDSDGVNVTESATFAYRVAGGEWKDDLTKSEWTNPGVIHVRATVEGYANRPTATFTIKSRGLILFFGPAN